MSVARNSNFQDISGFSAPPNDALKIGTVGWDGDNDVVDIGTDTNDGRTLVKVTLFEGRDPFIPSKPGVAAGRKIYCQVGWPNFQIPPRGYAVLVGFPDGNMEPQGAGCIIFTFGKSPTKRFAEDRVNLNYGDKHLVIEAASVTITDGKKNAITVGVPKGGDADVGLGFFTAQFSGGQIGKAGVGFWGASDGDAKAVLQLTPDQVSIVLKDAGQISLKPLKTLISGTTVDLTGTVIAGVGPAAIPVALSPLSPSASLFTRS